MSFAIPIPTDAAFLSMVAQALVDIRALAGYAHMGAFELDEVCWDTPLSADDSLPDDIKLAATHAIGFICGCAAALNQTPLEFCDNAEFEIKKRRALQTEMQSKLDTAVAAVARAVTEPAAHDARIKVTDRLGNVAFVHYANGWRCTLANGIPAALHYAGISHRRETEARFALDDCTTATQVLAVVTQYTGGHRTVELSIAGEKSAPVPTVAAKKTRKRKRS